MASVDDRIVAISFENTKFEAGIARTMASLKGLDSSISNIGRTSGDFSAPMTAMDRLKAKLHGLGAGSVFSSMERDASHIHFSGLLNSIDTVRHRFSILRGAASVALGSITAMAAQKGLSALKSITVDPIVAGFHNMETQINAVQTILANTGLKGPQGLAKVQAALNNLNVYANKTVYNFSQMAKNIGTFTAAGVKLGPATASIKGIANLAALSGSSSEQASTAMYQLSQAIAAGQVHLQDWNSVVNAGMGGAVFQKALIRTGQAMGTIKQGAVDIDKATGRATINGQAFRQSISAKPGQTSWLTSDVLVKTLQQFTGDMTAAQLKAEGFSASQAKTILTIGKTAQNAATKIKTFSQLTQALKEEVASAWGKVFSVLFGNINQSKALFSALHTSLESALTGPILKFADTLQEWAKLGGRRDLLSGLKSAWKDISDILKPIKEAFREIFPPTTAKGLLTLTENFKSLMDSLRPSKQTMDDIKRTFAGFFAVLHIGWDIIKIVAKAIGGLFAAAAPAGGGLLSLTARFGDFLVKLDKFVSGKAGADAVFKGMEGAAKGVLEVIKHLTSAIKNLFTGGFTGASSALSSSVGGLGKSLGPLSGILATANRAWQGFLHILGDIKKAISPTLDKIADVVGHFGDIVENGIRNADYSKVFSAVQTVLIGGIFLAIKKAIGGGVSVDFGGGLLKNLSNTFKALTGNLEVMQKNIQAHTLLDIAIAIGILAAGIFLLAQVPADKLSTAMTAVAIGMGELVGVVFLLNKAMGAGFGFAKITVVAGSLILLATAVTILAGAMKIFATMSWEELAKGLTGVAGALTAVAVGTKLMDGPKLLVTAAALLPLAIALNILAVALKIFATLSWDKMIRGLTALGGSLAIISLGMKAMPTDMPLVGAGLLIVSAGLIALAIAVSAFGHLKIGTIVKGIAAMGAAMVVLGLALEAFPPGIALQAAALILVAGALSTMAVAIGLMGSMNILTLVKGILAMGAALAVLGVGLDFMAGTLPGSAALLVAAAAFAILAPAIGLLGVMPWGVILKALGAMALTLGVLAVVGALASSPLIALGLAIGALGLGLLAVGAAVYLFAKGISLLSDTSVKAVAALIAAVTLFISAFPNLIIKFAKGLVDIIQSVVQLAPKIIDALIKIINDLLTAIPKVLPKLAIAIGSLITTLIDIINQNAGPIIDAGIHLLENLLSGIASNIGQVTDSVASIIANFLSSLAKDLPRIIAAGAALLVAWLSGVTKHIPKIIGAVGKMIVTFINAVAHNLGRIIDSGENLVTSFISSIFKQIPKLIRAGTNIIVNIIKGIGKAAVRIVTAATDTIIKFVNALAKNDVKIVNAGFNAIIKFLNGIAKAIRTHSHQMEEAGWRVASAIIDGIFNGLTDLAGHVIDKLGNIAQSMLDKVTSIFSIGSPSKEMYKIGSFVMLGLAQGIDKTAPEVHKSITSAAKDTVKSAKSEFGKLPKILDGVDSQPVIRPILDLSHVKKHVGTLNDLISGSTITAKLSSDQAVRISGQQSSLKAGKDVQAPVTNVNFTQNNHSPEPLPAVEIYRQTKNQVNQLKHRLGVGPGKEVAAALRT